MRKWILLGVLSLALLMTGCLKSNENEVEPMTDEVLEPGAVEVENQTYQFPESEIQGFYTGPMIDNVPVGTGRFEYDDTYKTIYVGTWADGLPNGLGTYEWKDGDRYVGEVFEGRLHGYGKYIYSSGVEHEGTFEHGVLIPDSVHGLGEQVAVGEYLVTVLNVIEAEGDKGRMMQVELLVENKFVDSINTAHCLSFQLYDGNRAIPYTNISTVTDLYQPLKLDESINMTAIFNDIEADKTYQLHYDFDTIGTGVAIFDLKTP